jgi:recombination protein RecA
MFSEMDSAATRQERFRDLRSRLQTGKREVVQPVLPTSIQSLDGLLGGGFPAGSLVTLEGPVSSGRWSIAACALAEATHRGLGAVIDDGTLYPPALAAAGVRLERLLVVPAKTPLGIARAIEVLLRSRAVRVVVMAAVSLRAAVWSRFAALAHRSGTVLVVIALRAAAELSSHAVLRIGCSIERAMFRGPQRRCRLGARGVWCTFAGFRVFAQVQKHRGISAGGAVRLDVAC